MHVDNIAGPVILGERDRVKFQESIYRVRMRGTDTQWEGGSFG